MGGASCRLGHPAHLALHPPFPSHGLIPVQAARDRSCLSSPITHRPARPIAHPITAAQPSFRRHVRSHCTAAPPSPSPSPLPSPSPAAADDSTDRFGPSATAEVGLPFRVVPGERPSTTGSTRPALLARVDLHPGPRERPVRAGLGPPHPLSIWPARRHGPGHQDDPPGLPHSKPHHQGRTPFRLHGPVANRPTRSITVPTARQSARRICP